MALNFPNAPAEGTTYSSGGLTYVFQNGVWALLTATPADFSAAAAQLGGRRNLLINGGFDVWQRGAAFSAAGYFADRWSAAFSGASISAAPGGLGALVTMTGTGFCNIRQGVEWASWMAGRTMTLTFRGVFGRGAPSVRLSLRNGGITGGNTFEDMIDDGSATLTPVVDDLYEVTFTVPEVPSGTPTMLLVVLSDGAFGVSGSNASLDVGQVQLEVGSVRTPFERRLPGEELRLCQRYFYKTDSTWHGGMYASTHFMVHIVFPVTMRVSPSETHGFTGGAGTYANSYPTKDKCSIYYNNTDVGYLNSGATFDAEL